MQFDTPNKAYPYCAVEQMPLSEISSMRLSLVPDGKNAYLKP